MHESKPAAASLGILTNVMNELAREIGVMDPDDQRRRSLVKGLSDLTQLRTSLRTEVNELIVQRMEGLAHEMKSLSIGEPRRAQIVNEIVRLSRIAQKH